MGHAIAASFALSSKGALPRTARRAVTCLLLCGCMAGGAGASIFGDGDPRNGSEDERDGYAVDAPRKALMAWQQSAGTIHCDGRIRGSATLVAPGDREHAPPGHFIATAAHVLWDLERGVRFGHCEFHFMGLSQLPGYQATIDDRWVRSGAFSPVEEISSHDFGEADWAFAYLPSGLDFAGRRGGLSLPAGELSLAQSVAKLRILAWNRDLARVTVSGTCRSRWSVPGDLGGGAWAGQLLDDCDSADGASGGALFIEQEAGATLVGIRSGAHWDGVRYPEGPPAGEPWDVHSNTNFARAITPELVSAFDALFQEVRRAYGAEGVEGRTSLP